MKKLFLSSLCLLLSPVGAVFAQAPALGNLPPSLPPNLAPVPAKPVAALASKGGKTPVAVAPSLRSYHALEDYPKYGDTVRMNRPESHIAWLKQHRFTHGELDRLPAYAIILHASNVTDYLGDLGYASNSYQALDIGSSDPNLLYVVTRPSGDRFIIDRGLPGAGGITSQVAELGALGVKYVVHIGACSVLGPSIKEQSLILPRSSYKDGAAILLSSSAAGKTDSLAYPDAAMTARLEALLREGKQDYVRGAGYTMPISYFQPSGLLLSLFDTARFGKDPRPSYLEMDEAPFFVAAEQMNMSATSLLIGTDRYIVVDGKLMSSTHAYDATQGRERALRAAVKLFEGLEPVKP